MSSFEDFGNLPARQDVFEPDELDWVAFCYLADELPEADRELFELQMAEDQQAREALARAVELTQTLSAIPACDLPIDKPSPQVGDRATWWRRAAWTAIAAAACWAFFSLFPISQDRFVEDKSPSDLSAQLDENGSRELAFAWVATVDEISFADRDDLSHQLVEESEAIENDDVDGASLYAEDDEPALEAPDWMLAAVQGLAAKNGISTEGRN